MSAVTKLRASFGAATISRASELPNYCAQLAVMLASQPLFDGKFECECSPLSKSKILILDKFEDTRIFTIFTKIAHCIFGKGEWDVYNFGKFVRLYDREGRQLPNGVCLTYYESIESCSLKILQDAYSEVYKNLVVGWKEANLKDHMAIMFPQNNTEYLLFIKERSMYEETTLICFIAKRLSVENDVKCADEWRSSEGRIHDKPYLWIRRSAYKEVVDKLGLQLPTIT